MTPSSTYHRAPWGTGQRVVTLLCCLLFLGSALSLLRSDRLSPWNLVLATALTGAIPLGAIFMVLGYEVTPASVRIRRPGWTTSVPLDGLRQAESGTDLLSGSLRLFGNGGFFSSTGWFWNRRLGRYRLYANDARRAVALRFDRRVVVIAPEDPERLVHDLLQQHHLRH
ncbi:MAG: hypothetical protein IT581_14585 [Verrucomicrobiales bacterium]|nr:hypothetical protein [Verrucomicrobiales bacterium]